MEQTFQSQIREFTRSARGAHRKVAEFLLVHGQDAAFMTVEDVARGAGVSPGTVSRAAKAMGFSGFPDVQERIRLVIRRTLSPAGRLEHAHRDSFDCSASLRQDQENLLVLSARLPEVALQEAAALLVSVDVVHVMGTRSSYSLAYFLAFNLGQIRPGVFLMDPKAGQLQDESRRLQAGSVFVPITFPRYTRDTLSMAEVARKASCRIVAISDSSFSPLAPLAEISLSAPYQSLSFFNSYVAGFALVNALIGQVAALNKERTTEALKQLNDLHKANGVFDESGYEPRNTFGSTPK